MLYIFCLFSLLCIQYISPASGGFAPDPTGALPLDSAGGLPCPPPLSKFLATPLANMEVSMYSIKCTSELLEQTILTS